MKTSTLNPNSDVFIPSKPCAGSDAVIDPYSIAHANDSLQHLDINATVSKSKPDSPLYVVRDSPGKGLGMFALTDIPTGSMILREKPFFAWYTMELFLAKSDTETVLNFSDSLGSSLHNPVLC
eukprot:768140_1